MSDIAIEVENISKKYLIGESKTYPTLRDALVKLPSQLFKAPKQEQEFWALRNLSFEIKRGEVVGIIGRNGAGKSTLLKILARITEPTAGQVTMYGRVASMLEVGTGFNPELTGRENIYLNGAIIGMTKAEIRAKFDEIVEFSGVGKFLDTPVKHYSSGMYVRLAFAVAAHLDADILLVDEVLAVGDTEFQKKCLNKMSDLASSGKTVLLVSHNLLLIESFTKTLIIMDNGKLSDIGPTSAKIQTYYKISDKGKKNITDHIIQNNDFFSIRSIELNGKTKDNVELNTQNRLLEFDFRIYSKKELRFSIEVILKDIKHNHIGIFSPGKEDSSKIYHLKIGKNALQSSIELPDSFHSGTYNLDLIFCDPGIHNYVYVTDAVQIEYTTPDINIFKSDINGAGFLKLHGSLERV